MPGPPSPARPDLEVEASFRVDRSRLAVYEFLTDTSSFRRVDSALIDYTPEGRMVAGMAGTMRHRRGGMTARTTWRVAALEPPTRIAIEIDGLGYRMTEVVTLDDAPDGTAVRVLDRLWGTSLVGRLFVAASRGFLRRDMEARGARLRTALEA